MDGWQEDEGHEVVHMLIGSAYLRDYATSSQSDLLLSAHDAFTEAYRINDGYIRNYLGLGSVALQQAIMPNENSEEIIQCPSIRSTYDNLDGKKLSEAMLWFDKTETTNTNQSPDAFVDVKAAYSLGQISLLMYECDDQKYTPDTANDYFNQVITASEKENTWDLKWFAGNAYYYTGRIAGVAYGNWEQMSKDTQDGISILETLPNNPAKSLIAEYWISVAFAEYQVGHPEEAYNAYCNAMQKDPLAVEELRNKGMKDFIDYLENGGSCEN